MTISKDSLIYDFGSYAFDVPLVSEIKEINFAQSNPCYRSGEEIKTKIILQNVTASSSLSWYVEDVYNRIIEKGNQPLKKGQEVADVNFKINYPLGILYRLFVKLDKSGEIQDISMGEFSMPFNFPPDDELMGYGWITAHGAHGFKMWKDNGFDVNMASGYNLYKRGMFKAMCNVNMRPCLNGVMYFAGDPDVGWRYRGDLGKEGDDTVRKPCYSDPSYWNKVKEEITLKLKDREMLYYGIKDYHIGDECFLGTNVCYSEWCLKDFRDYLRKEYNRLSSLNNTWKTNYKSWEEVTPIQLKGVDTKKNNMAAWLDHKMFMTTVFARLGERIKSIIREESAGMEIRVGFSGMQNPGFSYNWEEMTKHLTLLRHYGGMQVDLVRSLHQPGTRYGRPTGYSSAYINAEKSVKYHIRRLIFNSANSVRLYHGGCAVRGD